MTHNFTTLTSVLGRCSSKVADQVIAEIRSAIDTAALQGSTAPAAGLADVSAAVHQKKAEQAAARKAQKATEKEATAKKATQAESSAERSESPRGGTVAKRKLSGAEAPDDVRCESCGEAEAEQFHRVERSLDAHALKHIEAHAVIERQKARARPSERGHMGGATYRDANIASERSNIGTLRDM